ncbi:thermonuclease family protein [Phenylobacterium sp.]|uniref:thermonuclease family protein n=1 Tax=Phenylobacterium sp. TaxID=1871053 RepID=UPI002730847E|nr:thermonuclease family protein [Phenylobacterium sp.]MDP1617914.1 thermonuclease family protein [Phenylobacterium sp.]
MRLRTKVTIRTLVIAGLAGLATPALADPCKAIPDRGPLPAYLARGSIFSGPVVYIGDGDSLCVAVGSGPENWVEVRVADFYAPELNTPKGKRAKATLERLVKGERAVCRAEKRSYDRMVARCEVGGRSIGELMRHAGVESGGRGR